MGGKGASIIFSSKDKFKKELGKKIDSRYMIFFM